MRLKVAIILLFAGIHLFAQQEKINELLKNYTGVNHPGIILQVYQDGKLAFETKHGYADITAKTPISTNLNFGVEHITKQFTALAIFQLQKDGLLNVSDKAGKYIDYLPNAFQNIEIIHLLTHSSGIPDPALNLKHDKVRLLTNTDIKNHIKSSDSLMFESGKGFRYNIADYFLLAEIIESISKKDWNKYIEKTIFKNFELQHAYIDNGKSKYKNTALGYTLVDNTFQEFDLSKIPVVKGNSGLYISPDEFYKVFANNSASNMYDESVYNIIFPNKIEGISNLKYSSGWFTDFNNWRRYYFHGGVNEAYSVSMVYIKNDNLLIMIYANRLGVYNMRKISFAVANMYSKFKYYER